LSNEWVVAGIEPGKPPKRASLDGAISCRHEDERTLEDLLLAGDVDAVITHRLPKGLATGTIKRLWSDLEAAEAEYYQKTRIIPLLHLPVVRQSLLDTDAEACDDLLAAFTRAKDMDLEELRQTVVFGVSLPSVGRA